MEENSENNSLVYSQKVIEFVTLANEYCKFVEQVKMFSRKEFADKSLKLAGYIYNKALLLPEIPFDGLDYYETFLTEADWEFLRANISSTFGELDVFVDFFEPANPDDNITINISECYADIYQDLKDFTMTYHLSSEEAVENALSVCLNNFKQYWGPRLIAVMQYLHGILFGDTDFEEKEEQQNMLNENRANSLIDKFLGDD